MKTTKELLLNAKKAFLNFELDKAFLLLSELLELDLSSEEKLDVLYKLCVLCETKDDFNLFSNYKHQYLVLFQSTEGSSPKIIDTLKKIEENFERKKYEREKPVLLLNLIAIGYWKSDTEPNLPHPSSFVVEEWDSVERENIIQHLEKGKVAAIYRGFSWCRFGCDEDYMGSKCLTDGIYIYPEGLVHYLKKHKVKLPDYFIKHVRDYNLILPDCYIQVDKVDYRSWMQATKD